MTNPHHEDHQIALFPFVDDAVGASAKTAQSIELAFERSTC
jgi:hypothetical protein